MLPVTLVGVPQCICVFGVVVLASIWPSVLFPSIILDSFQEFFRAVRCPAVYWLEGQEVCAELFVSDRLVLG